MFLFLTPLLLLSLTANVAGASLVGTVFYLSHKKFKVNVNVDHRVVACCRGKLAGTKKQDKVQLRVHPINAIGLLLFAFEVR